MPKCVCVNAMCIISDFDSPCEPAMDERMGGTVKSCLHISIF